jgi:uncharacterized protein (DUF342 family)
MRSLDHSTAQTIWKETVGRGKSSKYYGAGTMSSNLVHNRCIYERSIDGEGGSRNVEMTPEMVTLIQQLSQEMQTRNQELEQVRTQSQKDLEEMRTQLKQQQDFFMQEIRRNRELVETMERRVDRRDLRRRRLLPQQDSGNNESLSSKDGGDDDDDEDSENA